MKPAVSSTLGASKEFYSLNLTGSAGVTIGTGYSLTLDSGGLIANTTTTGGISGGTLKGSPSGELVVNVVKTTPNFAASSIIDNNGGPTALVKTGPGTLTLSGVSTNHCYTGDTYINQGTLEYALANNLSYGGVISGAGNLLKSGTAWLTLGDANTYTGTTTVTGGMLLVNGSLAAETAVSIQGGAELDGSGTIFGNVTASQGVIEFGGPIMGSVTVSGNSTLPSQSAQLAGGLNYTSINSSMFGGLISGAGKAVTLNAPSGTMLTLIHANTYTGGTTTQNGTLKAGTNNAFGTGSLTIGAGGTLDLNGKNCTFTSLDGLAGGTLTTDGPATLTVNMLAGSSSNYAGSFLVTDNSTLNVGTANSSLALSGALSVSNNKTLTKLGAGTLIISGSQSWGAGSVLQIGGSGGSAPEQVMLLGGGLNDNVTAGSAYGGGLASGGSVVPEPSTWALLFAAAATLAACGLLRFRSRLFGVMVGVRRR